MNNEMININANLVDEIKTNTFTKDDKEVTVANFTLVKKYGSGKEYINCSVYGEKTEITKNFKKGDFIHVYGYYKENKKADKVYKNFIVKSLNKIEKEENKEEK
ncbi:MULTISPECIES: single-stranded DNA-binding protein [unclassified Gemella]|uniref:single-stranded DNA-binding protein n=1 Tax=unclassified Gemella TaxID=2624949 RepID=UPI001C057A7A|nr:MULTISPECIES: single-stranded DNA-binding protein [unclassified Gemella]MBU0279168.1 single-stranded DNA-binding protein [Gemella sp. zg-1178]QWQ38632.1 single-stranded DNA-binding protein [Gemella sp. zg-570]